MDKLRVFGLATMFAILSACSPYSYSKQVGEFATSVNSLTNSVTSGHDALVADTAATRRIDMVYKQKAVALSPSCQPGTVPPVKDDPPCLAYPADGNAKIEDPYPIHPNLQKSILLLKGYAGGLAAVTNANDRTEFNTAFGKLAKSVSGLVSAVPGAGPAAGAIAAAGINVFAWIVGTSLDIERFRALRDAVNEVDKPVGTRHEKPIVVIAKAFQETLISLSGSRRNELYLQATTIREQMVGPMSPETYKARLADLESVLAIYEGLRRLDPKAAANGLVEAHTALVDAVNNPKLDLAALVQSLGEFKDKVSALEAAITAASAPAQSAGSGKK